MSLGAPKAQESTTLLASTITTTSETALCTVSGIDTTPEGDQVQLQGNVDLTPGAGSTSVTLRIRRGAGTAGQVVGVGQGDQVVAGQPSQTSAAGADTPGELSGGQYTLTAQLAGATANSSVTAASLQALY